MDQEQQKRKTLTTELLAAQAETLSLKSYKESKEKEITELKNTLASIRNELISLNATKSLEEAQVK